MSPKISGDCLLEDQDQENRDPNVGRFAREFSKVDAIKDGRFSKVWNARHKMDKQVYAVKVQVAPNEVEQQVLLREVIELSSIWTEGQGCSGLLHYFAAWQEDDMLHVQTEPYQCSLRDHMADRMALSGPRRQQHIAEQEVVSLLREVAAGLGVLHSHGIAHMDVRPENVMMTSQGCFKIAGLGRCCRLSSVNLPAAPLDIFTQNCDYVAPDLLHWAGEPTDLQLGDIFSLALVACELAASPIALSSNGSAWQQLRSGRLCEPLLPMLLGEPVLALLRCMLCSTPDQRPSCEDIVQRASDLHSRTLPAQTFREQRKAELRQALCHAEEAAERERQRGEVAKLELEALRCGSCPTLPSSFYE